MATFTCIDRLDEGGAENPLIGEFVFADEQGNRAIVRSAFSHGFYLPVTEDQAVAAIGVRAIGEAIKAYCAKSLKVAIVEWSKAPPTLPRGADRHWQCDLFLSDGYEIEGIRIHGRPVGAGFGVSGSVPLDDGLMELEATTYATTDPKGLALDFLRQRIIPVVLEWRLAYIRGMELEPVPRPSDDHLPEDGTVVRFRH